MKAVIYARYSDRKQDGGYSIQAQVDACREYAEKQGWEVGRVYEDRAMSGTNDQREEFQRMIADASRGKASPFQVLLIHNTNRFARSRVDSVMHKHMLRKRGVQIISVTQAFLSQGTPEDVIFEGIFEALDEYYSRNLARDILKGMKKHIEAGYWKGGNAPLGYKLDRGIFEGKRRSRLIISEMEAPIVRKAFKLYLQGNGFKSVANMLNQDGHRNRLGGKFGNTHIQKILRSETYAGCTRYGDGPGQVFVENTHPSIIDRRTFDDVQQKIQHKTRQEAPIYNNGYYLSGTLVCGNCGCTMVGISAKSGRYFYYACNRRVRENSCESQKIPREKLHRIVFDSIKREMLTRERVRNVVRDILTAMRQRVDTSKEELTRVLKDLSDQKQRLQRLYQTLEETKELDYADLAPRIKQLRENIEDLESRKDGLTRSANTTPPALKDLSQPISEYFNALDEFLARDEVWQSKEMVQRIIKSVRVTGSDLKIEWQFPELGTHSNDTGRPVPPLFVLFYRSTQETTARLAA